MSDHYEILTLIGSDDGQVWGTHHTMSKNGQYIATHTSGSDFTGEVWIGKWNSSTESWDYQTTFTGSAVDDNFGRSLSFSRDGTRLAVGAYADHMLFYIDNDIYAHEDKKMGYVRVYQNSDDSWSQLGSDIVYQSVTTDYGFGNCVSFDGAGDQLAIGTEWGGWEDSGTTNDIRKAFVYIFNGSDWDKQITIDSPDADSLQFGAKVAFNDGGDTLGVSSYFNNNTYFGTTFVFNINGSDYSLKGTVIFTSDSVDAPDGAGHSISFSSDGNRVAIGAPGALNLGLGGSLIFNHAAIHVYDYNAVTSDWELSANIQDQEATADFYSSSLIGYEVALTGDGNTLIASSPYNVIQRFQYSDDTWNRSASDIVFDMDHFPYGLSIKDDASVINTSLMNGAGTMTLRHINLFTMPTDIYFVQTFEASDVTPTGNVSDFSLAGHTTTYHESGHKGGTSIMSNVKYYFSSAVNNKTISSLELAMRTSYSSYADIYRGGLLLGRLGTVAVSDETATFTGNTIQIQQSDHILIATSDSGYLAYDSNWDDTYDAPNIICFDDSVILFNSFPRDPWPFVNNVTFVSDTETDLAITGMSINSTTGIISGTPTSVAGWYDRQYTMATSDYSQEIRIYVEEAPEIIYATDTALFYATDTESTSVRFTNGTIFSYYCSDLVAGLSIDSETGTISNDGSAAPGASDYTVTATTRVSDVSDTLNIEVYPTVTYPSDQVFFVGRAIDAVDFTISAGANQTDRINEINNSGCYWNDGGGDATQNGLTLGAYPTAGQITGTPENVVAASDYNITLITSGFNELNVPFTFTVEIYPSVAYTSDTINVYVGESVSLTVSDTGTINSLSLSPSLPTGLSVSDNGAIVGIPTVSASDTYTLTADTNTSDVTFEFDLNVIPLSISYDNYSYVVDVAVSDVTPTINANNFDSLSISPSLPTGFSFNTSTGVINGTPTVTSSDITYTVTGTGSNIASDVTADFTLEVTSTATLGFSNSTVEIQVGSEVNIIPIKSQNVNSLSISPDLPSGLTLNTTTGAITGTLLSSLDATTYTLTGIVQHGVDTRSDPTVEAEITLSSVETAPCFGGNTLVKTPDGFVPIKKLSSGDYVCCDNVDKPVRIKLVKTYFTKDKVYRIPKNHFGKDMPFKDLIVSGLHKININQKSGYQRVCNIMNDKYIINWDEPIWNIRLSNKHAKCCVNGIQATTLKKFKR